MTDNQANSNYQDILDKYAQSLSSTQDSQIPQEKIKPEPELEPKVAPEAILTPEEETLLKSQSQAEFEPEAQISFEDQSLSQSESPFLFEEKPESETAINLPLEIPLQSEEESEPAVNPPSQIEAPPMAEAITSPEIPEAIIPSSPQIELPPESSEIMPKKENHFFKYLFFFSLFVFIVILISVVISFINTQKSIPDSPSQPEISPSPSEAPTAFCELNNKQYSVGESFPATDGCNTCTCGDDLIISCTEDTCDTSISATPSLDLSPTLTIEAPDQIPSP